MVTSTLRQSIADRRAKQGDKGFTLIELLVVVLIIGILAAIAIPVFLGQQDQAKDAALKSDLANAKLAYISYYTDKTTYLGVSNAAATATALSSYGYVASTGNNSNVEVKTAGASFCLEGKSGSTGNAAWKITATGPAVAGAC